MKKLLKLQDHKHTAKKLSHHHTSYRGLSVVLAFFGICFLLVGNKVGADSYVVTASVAAPIPTVAAQITSPSSQTTLSSANIVISGTCPIVTPAVVVILYRDGSMLGSAGCNNQGVFAGTFTLEQGINSIVPRVMTITNQFGPDGAVHTLTYEPVVVSQPNTPAQPAPTPVPAQPPAPDELQIKTDTPILVFKPNQSFVWKLNVAGGETPYTIIVDWGDGTKSTYSASGAGEQSLEHVFQKNKNTVVRVSVKDATGKEVFTSVAGVTFRAEQVTPSVNGISTAATVGALPIGTLWTVYGVTVAMLAAFWFGTHAGSAALLHPSNRVAPKRSLKSKKQPKRK